MIRPEDPAAVREAVRSTYAAHARAVARGAPSSGCGCAEGGSISAGLYEAGQAADVPSDALAASLGCGNPTALADLRPGEIVLDLGSGGGIDVLLSAKRVGPTGLAYGLDMTDEMLALAERNRAAAGAGNVRFLKGTIEEVPLPDASVDVVISNCVINLSTDKGRVLREAFRVLRPGGRFAVSDVVAQGAIPASIRRDMESWSGCIAGALEEGEYRKLLEAAGFEGVEIQVTRVHDTEELAAAGGGCCGGAAPCGPGPGSARGTDEGRLVSAFVRARKPRPPAQGR